MPPKKRLCLYRRNKDAGWKPEPSRELNLKWGGSRSSSMFKECKIPWAIPLTATVENTLLEDER